MNIIQPDFRSNQIYSQFTYIRIELSTLIFSTTFVIQHVKTKSTIGLDLYSQCFCTCVILQEGL